MLEGVVEKGTATNLKSDNIKIAGKTGTTLIYNQKTGYKEKSYQASFAGYFPAENPRYSCIVVIYSPQNYVYHGAYVAGPVFKEIADKVFATSLDIQKPLNAGENRIIEIPYSKNGYLAETHIALQGLNIKSLCEESNAEWVITEKHDEHIALKPKRIIDRLVPDVVSMGLKDAVFLLENMGMQVEVVGRGSIRSQSIPPGTRITRGDKIKLELSFTEG
jgi:cell division protein FtsI (penicillin-binding protein 3)